MQSKTYQSLCLLLQYTLVKWDSQGTEKKSVPCPYKWDLNKRSENVPVIEIFGFYFFLRQYKDVSQKMKKHRYQLKMQYFANFLISFQNTFY